MKVILSSKKNFSPYIGISLLTVINYLLILVILSNYSNLYSQQTKLGEQNFPKNVVIPKDPRIYNGEKKIKLQDIVPPTFVWSKEMEILRDWAEDEQKCQEKYNDDYRWWRNQRRMLLDDRDVRRVEYDNYVVKANKRIDNSNDRLMKLWNETLEKIKKLKEQCNERDDKLRDEIIKKMAEEAKAIQDKENELAELRAGLFCSKCKRSKSEIEKTGLNFYQHVQDVKGRVEPLSPEEIQKKEDEWDSKIQQIHKSYDPMLITQRFKEQESCRKRQRELEEQIENARWKNVDEVNDINREIYEHRKQFDRFISYWNQSWNENNMLRDRIEERAQTCLELAGQKRDNRLFEYRKRNGG